MSIVDKKSDSIAPVAAAGTTGIPAVETPPGEPTSTRRELFALGAAVMASAVLPGRASAQRVVRPLTTRPATPQASGDALLRLVRRVTNGVTMEELTLAGRLGFSTYLYYHLNPATIEDSAVEAFVATNYPLLKETGTNLYAQNQGTVLSQLQEATLYRAAFSRRQLYERMVEFWTDHFNIAFQKVNYLKVLDDRQVIRKHALGKFPDLLRASAHSAAMLEYLDNTRSRGTRVNQNYARELMELHTMGVDGGYTQRDVEEVTRCLTGWTIAGRGDFRFDPTGHDFTAKTVLGTFIPAMSTGAGAAAIQDGEKVLDLLLAHPSTAKFISTKMIRWLLQYDPPASLVTTVAATYTRTGGDIPSMIRDILTPANLLAAPAKYRQPYQLLLAALRATEPYVRSMAPVNRQLPTVGQALFQWEEPDGYPDYVDWWSGMVLQRWNMCSFLTGLAGGDFAVDVGPLMQVPTAAGIVEAISKRAFGGQMPAELKQQLTSYMGSGPATTTRTREAFALALSSTAFQWY